MERWEDALDVDDSDLPTLLRPSATLLPCNNRPNPNPNPNPSPSPSPSPCEVQTQTLTLCSQSQNPQTLPDSNPNPSSGSSDRTGRLIPGPAGAIQAAMLRQNAQSGNSSRICDDGILRNEFPDGDFNGNPWLCALDFLGLEEGSRLQHTIESTRNMERVPQAVAFSPTRSSRYLNVTPSNVVKIISKNSGPPPKRSFPASKVSSPVLEEHMETRPEMAEVTSFRKGADEVDNGFLWRDPGNGEGTPAGRRPEDAAGGSNFSSTILRKASVIKEPFLHETCGRNGVKKLIPKVSVADWTDEQLLELFPEDE